MHGLPELQRSGQCVALQTRVSVDAAARMSGAGGEQRRSRLRYGRTGESQRLRLNGEACLRQLSGSSKSLGFTSSNAASLARFQ
jgi:hypothetical protein